MEARILQHRFVDYHDTSETEWEDHPLNERGLGDVRSILEGGSAHRGKTLRIDRGDDWIEWRLQPYPTTLAEAYEAGYRLVKIEPASQNGSWVITAEVPR